MPTLLRLLAMCTITCLISDNAISAEDKKVKLFDMVAIRDSSTLDVSVVKDWHVVDGQVSSRQKVVEITVGEAYPGKDYRVLVQFVVPADRKAKGFTLTAGVSKGDVRIGRLEAELLSAGVGFVKTHSLLRRRSSQAAPVS